MSECTRMKKYSTSVHVCVQECASMKNIVWVCMCVHEYASVKACSGGVYECESVKKYTLDVHVCTWMCKHEEVYSGCVYEDASVKKKIVCVCVCACACTMVHFLQVFAYFYVYVWSSGSHGAHVEARVQLVGVGFLFYRVGSEDQTQTTASTFMCGAISWPNGFSFSRCYA